MDTAWSKPTKYVMGISLALLGVYILHLSRPVIPLLIVAALIAVLVRPVILWLHLDIHLPRGLAVGIVYLGVAILVPLVLVWAVPAAVNALEYVLNLDYAAILQNVTAWLRSSLIGIKAIRLPVVGIDAYVDRTVDALLAQFQQAPSTRAIEPPPVPTILQSLSTALTVTFDAAAGLVGVVVSQVTFFIFMILASIYISLDAHTYRAALLRTLPAAYQPEIAVLLARIERLWSAFFRGQLTLMLVIGILSWLGLMILGVPGAPYLGIISGLLEIIPNIGPILATIPAVLVALLQGSTFLPVSPLALALLVILFYVLLQQLENSLIVPRILGDAVGLPPLIVMTGVVVGASIGGILGTLLATPVIGTGHEILRYIHRKMLGEEPFLIGEEALKAGPRPSRDFLRQWWGRLQRLSRPRSSISTRTTSETSLPAESDPDAVEHSPGK